MSQEVALPSERNDAVAIPDGMPGGDGMPVSELMLWAWEARQAASIADSLSRTSFVPASLRGKPADITAAILAGQELGLRPMATLRSIDVIQGTPALRAHAMRGLLQSQGHSIQLMESTPEYCIMRGRRKGEDEWQSVTWTVERAAALGLMSKDQWKKQPQTMLVARATGEICRLIASDAIHAMPYVAEELGDNASNGSVPPQRITMTQLTGQTPEEKTAAYEQADRETDAQVAEINARHERPVEAINDAPATPKQRGMIHGLATKLGLDTKTDRAEYLAVMSATIGRDVTSSTDLTKAEASQVIELWTVKADQAPVDAEVEPTHADLYRQVQEAAKNRGFTSDQQLRTALEEQYGQPVDDITVDQLQEFLAGLGYGTVKAPK